MFDIDIEILRAVVGRVYGEADWGEGEVKSNALYEHFVRVKGGDEHQYGHVQEHQYGHVAKGGQESMYGVGVQIQGIEYCIA